MRIDRRLLGWGLFLIIVGAIPLLVRGGYLDRGWLEDWPSLWPLLLIGWGVALVLRRTPGELLGNAVSLIVLGVMVGGLIATGFGGFPAFGACRGGTPPGASSFGSRSGTLSDGGRISVELSCGALTVGAVDGSDWRISGRDPGGQGPEVVADLGRVRINARDAEFRGFTDDGSTWSLEVPRAPRLDVGVDLSAGEGTIDLTGANLGSLDMTLSAGAFGVRAAEAAALSTVNGTLNAGSATLDLPGSVRNATLTLNLGSMTVCLPAGTPVSVRWNGALGSNNFAAAGLEQIDDQQWRTVGLNLTSDSYLQLRASANAGSFNLELGGSCDA